MLHLRIVGLEREIFFVGSARIVALADDVRKFAEVAPGIRVIGRKLHDGLLALKRQADFAAAAQALGEVGQLFGGKAAMVAAHAAFERQ